MALERPAFLLLHETLKYLDYGVVGKVINIIRNKNNKFVFHMSLPICEKINTENLQSDLINKDVLPLSSVRSGSLLTCLHPYQKKWLRCYVISVLHCEANVALCDTGEVTKTKKLKDIPDRYKNIPAITFEANIMCICPLDKLRHLMENFEMYTAVFKPLSNVEILKVMTLTCNDISIDFIIKKWDPQSCFNSNIPNYNNSPMFKNGSAVMIAKAENYDWRHVFVRSIDQFVNVCKHLQTYCKNELSILRNPIVGDTVAVKCMDQFYRGKIIDTINSSCFYLYLIDFGYVISASIDSLVDLSDVLKKIPSTVCLVGLKDITLKPWTPEISLYITTLFKNSTTLIMEYNDHDPFDLDSVTLTTINGNEDVNGHIQELLKSVEDKYNDKEHKCLNYNHNLKSFTQLLSTKIIPVKVDNLIKSGSKIMPENIGSALLPRSVVYMTGFSSLNEIYIRKLEDYNDEFDTLLNMVNAFCLSATPINRSLEIGEIVGAQSILDKNYYRGKILKQIDEITYFIQYIDFGDKDNVPISNIFEIPICYMTPSNVMEITLNGVKAGPMNADALSYITSLLSNYTPMMIDFSPLQPFKNVNLTTVNDNENVNERLIELLKQNSKSCMPSTEDINRIPNSNHLDKKCNDKNVVGLKNGDSVYITMFIDVHHIFVRKVEDEDEHFQNFIANVDSYCSSEPPIGKLPKLNDIIGAKSIDGSFYRAKVIKKISDASYNVQFIDYGTEENVNLSDIVPLSSELKLFIPTAVLVKLKGIPFISLNSVAHDYANHISENETLIVDYIDNNEVILKTDKNENVNDHFQMLLFDSNVKNNIINLDDTEEKLTFKCNDTFLNPGDIVYITTFVDLKEIYIRKLEDYNDEFNMFLDKVNAFYLSATPINRPLVIGEIVGARSTLDNCFYRGKVLEQINNATYLIRFIDFGDCDNVDISNIFEISKDFLIPSTVIKITLKGINSSYAPCGKVLNYISNLFSTYEPMAIDFDPQLYPIEATLKIINSNENVNDSINKLIKNEDIIADNNVIKKCATENIVPILVQNIVESNRKYKLKSGDIVYITAYIDLCNIYVRKVNDNDDFKKLNKIVDDFCSSGNITESKSLELNLVVGAKSSSDGFFYRAKIIEKTDENNCDIMFIDFGFEENVNISDIVLLPIELQQVISSIYLVGLKGSTFDVLNLEDHEFLENLIFSSEFMKIEFDDINAVTLTTISQELNVIDHLNKLHENDSIMDETIVDTSLQHTLSMKYISHNIIIPQITPLINKSIVTIQEFVGVKDINISVSYDKLQFNTFLKTFSEFCLRSQPINRKPLVGELFAIRSSIDGSFNRGSVKEILNENEYKVVLFDLGTTNIVSINSFIEIPKEVKQVPPSIYSVNLKNVNYENLNDEAVSYMNTLRENNMPLIIEFDESSPNALCAVILTSVKTQQNINNHLVKLLAEKERDSPETVQMLSKGDIIYISSFVNLQTIYVRCINDGTDKFKSFLENFSSCCALNEAVEKEPVVGNIYAAKKNNESKYYRAEINFKVDNEHFNVCFIDFGSRDIVHKNNIIKLTESQLKSCPPTFMVSLNGFDSKPVKAIVMQFIKKISDTETFIIDSITKHNEVILISVNTQCNINEKVKQLITNTVESKIQDEICINNDNLNDVSISILKYNSPIIGIPIQVWVAEKLSILKYLVYTYESRIEFMQLEKQIFNDSKTFDTLKCLECNMPCIVYFTPFWYRGVISEIIDKFTANVTLIDVGNFSVIRNIKEIFKMPSKYLGKSLLMNIEIQPEPQANFALTTFKIVPTKYLDDGTILAEVVESSVDQFYDILENVGLPSFSSTPIPQDFVQSFCYSSCNEDNSIVLPDILSEQQSIPSNMNLNSKQFLNMLTIKDVQYARWLQGSSKTLTVLCMYQDSLVIMRDHLIDDTLADLETKIQNYCLTITKKPYIPAVNELCLAKYSDELWYRAICMKTANKTNECNLMVYFLDWGIDYSVNIEDICKMPKDFVYLPATAHKCHIEGADALKWSAGTMTAVMAYMYTQVDCKIVEKLSNDTYVISCDTIKDLVNSYLQ